MRSDLFILVITFYDLLFLRYYFTIVTFTRYPVLITAFCYVRSACAWVYVRSLLRCSIPVTLLMILLLLFPVVVGILTVVVDIVR